MRSIRRTLDGLYWICGVLAACCLIGILILIVIQMVARWTSEVFSGAPDYAGYCMAAASFLAFAYALNAGSHIRVNLLINALGKHRKWGETWCFGIGSLLSVFFAYFAIKMTYWSWKFNDISQGQDATPLWIPQLAMCVGTVALAIAFIDNFVQLIVTGKHGVSSDGVELNTE